MRTDEIIKTLLDEGRLRVDLATGHVYAPKSNSPQKPLGAKTSKGYLRTCINHNGKQVYIMLHRVVCIAAHGMPPSPLMQVNHLGDGKTDNRPDKIERASQARNMQHAKAANLLKPSGTARTTTRACPLIRSARSGVVPRRESGLRYWQTRRDEARQLGSEFPTSPMFVVCDGLRAGLANKASEYRAILKEME